jgi:hypothetical protein
MHPQPLEFFARVRAARNTFTGDVIEAGSLDMNGSGMDEVFADATSHEGVDWRAGKNVSVVAVFHEYETERRFDTALCTEMAEHDPFWRLSLAKMVELLKPGGNLFFSCAARARPVHEKHVGIDMHYQGLDLVDVLAELRKVGSFREIIAVQNIAPADTYIAALGKRSDAGTAPGLSVVIPACQSRFVPHCLSTHWTLSTGDTEFIVVANGMLRQDEDELLSLPVTPAILALYDVNLGFPGACNVGIQMRHPQAKAVALVNDDTEALVYHWDRRVLDILAGEPDVGALSPVTNFVANPYQQHGIMPTPELYDVPLMFFVWVALPVRTIDSVGLLDERYGLGNYEDVDYSIRLRIARLRMVVDPIHAVHHHGHGTFGTLPDGQFQALLRNAEAVLRSKWGAQLTEFLG